MKKALLIIPEYFLIASVLFYCMSTAQVINPIAIALLVILILQIKFKNRFIGILLPALIIVICLYLLLALFSELSEFSTFGSEAKTLLFVGLSYFLLTIAVSGLMIYKYGKANGTLA